MSEKLALIVPELILFVATCIVMITGQWPVRAVRQFTPWICAVALFAAAGVATATPEAAGALFPALIPYAKVMIAMVGLLLLLLLSGTVDRALEDEVDKGKKFLPIRSNRGEFYAFFMFSLTGLMLTASADDLIWLFLALELTSLPTYIMVAISTNSNKSREAGVKYFFLGALGAAIFLYGFALIYGATGSTNLAQIAASFSAHGLGSIGTMGMLVAIIGVCFKIAAFPMHFYTPDVYQGAASPVSAMLAFVPKTAGFLAMILLLGSVGWDQAHGLPEQLNALLWIIAAFTMTVGNALALIQKSVKRMLAYSSIAHSGYMLVGLIAGPGASGDPFWRNGIAAVLFYLLCYGVMTVGVFAVLSALEKRNGQEADDIDDIRGICKTHPALGWTLVICTLSMLGFPPLLGFVGKLGIFSSGITSGNLILVVILGINSAIAAWYYLGLVAAAYLDKPGDSISTITVAPFISRRVAGVLSAAGVIVLLVFSQPIIEGAHQAAAFAPPTSADAHHAEAGLSAEPISLMDD
ncbi:MAG: NADH-quinone oxidoreductase subunit N [Phycisphaerales bacterium]|nr:NADH-quinone oxidoreductase subunit N [Phycisphaerales bacterium]